MDRKALIREYKQSQLPAGVYRVRNTADQRSLIGASRNLPAILNRHLAQLRMGAHSVRELQSDWKRLGPDSFQFEILDTLKPSEDAAYDPTEDLRILEQMWRDKLVEGGERLYGA